MAEMDSQLLDTWSLQRQTSSARESAALMPLVAAVDPLGGQFGFNQAHDTAFFVAQLVVARRHNCSGEIRSLSILADAYKRRQCKFSEGMAKNALYRGHVARRATSAWWYDLSQCSGTNLSCAS